MLLGPKAVKHAGSDPSWTSESATPQFERSLRDEKRPQSTTFVCGGHQLGTLPVSIASGYEAL